MKTLNLVAAPLMVAMATLCDSTALAAAGSTTDLRGVTQNWDKVLPADNPGGPCPSSSSRFTCVMNNKAVRDNETGLVWAQPVADARLWHGAGYFCNNLATGGRKGWRLPTAHELASLVEANSPWSIALPAGHPFEYIAAPNGFWTSTSVASTYGQVPDAAFAVIFQRTAWYAAGTVTTARTNYDFLPYWCVRGGAALTSHPE